jgi:Zn-dependent protease
MTPAFAMEIVACVFVLIVAITFHEAAHGFVARLFGDTTATRMGRVTFNPLKHIDLFGTILLPGFMMISGIPFLFGYAKPVPVNFMALHPRRLGMILVAASGPGTNLLLAWASALLLHINSGAETFGNELLVKSVQFNVVLAIFNMLPIPPLDGGRVLAGLLPQPLAGILERIEPYGFIILLGLIALPHLILYPMGIDINPLREIMMPLVHFLTSLVFLASGH